MNTMEKHYNARETEAKLTELWDKEALYKFDPHASGKIYSIDTPPPTVSGKLHIGHLFSYTQAEIIARYHRVLGENVFYPFGFDDNGLPTERLVEREQGIRAKDMPRSKFTKICRLTAQKYEDAFRKLWKSLGISADWSAQYETSSPHTVKISQSLFLELARKGKAYVKDSPVLWCTECQTSIAQAELDTAEIESAFNYIPFMVDGTTVTVATTRPELLYGCVCLFVNPEDKRYSPLIGKKALVPLYEYEIPVLGDPKAQAEKGTGVVMCATFGDSTDAEWFKEHSLPYRRILLPDGTIAEDVPYIGGMKVHDARKAIIKKLEERGLLLKSKKITHGVAVHERCGKEVEIIPSRQWYIDILSEKDRFLQAADEISWNPPYMKNRYISWVQNLKWDWCVSRQRYYGVPFPVWYCKSCGKPVFPGDDQLPVNPLETEYRGSCQCGCTEFIPESAVLDTWATSSVTPQINEALGIKLTPMSMRSHAHEIIRTWTFYSIVRSLYHTGKIPWENLMISGFVLAKKGEKISKSKANSALEPEKLIEAHSADALRYWSAGARLGTDTFFDPEELSGAKRFITKLWNASKFAGSLLADMDLRATPELTPVDSWILTRVNETVIQAKAYLDMFETGLARREIDDLFWKDLCDNYIEIVKSRLYEPDSTSEKQSAQYALYHSLLSILKMHSIFVPFITDRIYRELFAERENTVSIHKTRWPQPSAPDSELLQFGEILKSAVSDMRKYKTENGLSMKSEIASMEINAPAALLTLFKAAEGDLRACSGAASIVYNAAD